MVKELEKILESNDIDNIRKRFRKYIKEETKKYGKEPYIKITCKDLKQIDKDRYWAEIEEHWAPYINSRKSKEPVSFDESLSFIKKEIASMAGKDKVEEILAGMGNGTLKYTFTLNGLYENETQVYYNSRNVSWFNTYYWGEADKEDFEFWCKLLSGDGFTPVNSYKENESYPETENLMDMNDNELKLRIELVPSTSWYNNLRKQISQREWDKIRKKVYADYGYKCGICGASGKLNCHEIWEYNDEKHIQKLVGFIALCDMCHFVKHIGLADVLASRGELDYEKVVEHFLKVNNCDRKLFEQHRKEAFAKWEERSTHEWQLDLGDYLGFFEKRK